MVPVRRSLMALQLATVELPASRLDRVFALPRKRFVKPSSERLRKTHRLNLTDVIEGYIGTGRTDAMLSLIVCIKLMKRRSLDRVRQATSWQDCMIRQLP